MIIHFKPTWLYIKQHNISGLKYFGKTTKSNPHKYKGSGKYWLNHLKVYGNDVSTIWVKLFTDVESLIEYSINFSKENDIAESNEWANLKFEDGLEGGHTGVPRSESTRKKLSELNFGKKHSELTKKKISDSNKGKHNIPKNMETREKIRIARKLQIMKPHSEETKRKMSQPRGKAITCSCFNCRKELSVSNLTRHHRNCSIQNQFPSPSPHLSM